MKSRSESKIYTQDDLDSLIEQRAGKIARISDIHHRAEEQRKRIKVAEAKKTRVIKQAVAKLDTAIEDVQAHIDAQHWREYQESLQKSASADANE